MSALDHLDEKEKLIWDFKYREGMTLRQMGHRLGISHQAAGRIWDGILAKFGDILGD